MSNLSRELRGDVPLSVQELLALHSFPAAWAGDKRIERLWVFDVKGAPETLWPHIADTSRMNRALRVADYLTEQRAELEVLSYASQALPEPVGIRRWTVYREAD